MVVFEAGGKEYTYPQNWHEVTLQQLIDFYANVEPTKPQRAKRINELQGFISDVEQRKVQHSLNYEAEYKASVAELKDLEEGLTDAEYLTEYLPYKARYVQHFVEGLDAMQLHPESLEALFMQLQSIFSTLPPEKPAYSIEFEDVIYHLPVVGMRDSTLAEFIAAVKAEEYFKAVAGNDYAALPYIIGILARPKDEPFDIEVSKKRAVEVFSRLTMDKAWKVYFFLRTLKSNLLSFMQTFTTMEASAQSKMQVT